MTLDSRRDEISKFQSKKIEGKPDHREETNQVTFKSQKSRNCQGEESGGEEVVGEGNVTPQTQIKWISQGNPRFHRARRKFLLQCKNTTSEVR